MKAKNFIIVITIMCSSVGFTKNNSQQQFVQLAQIASNLKVNRDQLEKFAHLIDQINPNEKVNSYLILERVEKMGLINGIIIPTLIEMDYLLGAGKIEQSQKLNDALSIISPTMAKNLGERFGLNETININSSSNNESSHMNSQNEIFQFRRSFGDQGMDINTDNFLLGNEQFQRIGNGNYEPNHNGHPFSEGDDPLNSNLNNQFEAGDVPSHYDPYGVNNIEFTPGKDHDVLYTSGYDPRIDNFDNDFYGNSYSGNYDENNSSNNYHNNQQGYQTSPIFGDPAIRDEIASQSRLGECVYACYNKGHTARRIGTIVGSVVGGITGGPAGVPTGATIGATFGTAAGCSYGCITSQNKFPVTNEPPKLPKMSDFPDTPKIPDSPKVPENSDNPKTPKNSDSTNNPKPPKNPENADKPQKPKTDKPNPKPENSDQPDTPKVPEKNVKSEKINERSSNEPSQQNPEMDISIIASPIDGEFPPQILYGTNRYRLYSRSY